MSTQVLSIPTIALPDPRELDDGDREFIAHMVQIRPGLDAAELEGYARRALTGIWAERPAGLRGPCDRLRAGCARCGAGPATILSKYDTDALCQRCKRDEIQAPGYARADAIETVITFVLSRRRQRCNFPGVGLDRASREFLAQLRAARGQEGPEP